MADDHVEHDSGIAHGTRLIYLDNVYAYGRVDGPMTESTPIAPCSDKGHVRASLLELLEKGHAKGLDYTVARSADFYGPDAKTSVFTSMVTNNVASGKAPVWMLDASQPCELGQTPSHLKEPVQAHQGEVLIEGADQMIMLTGGDSAAFPGDTTHSYATMDSQLARFSLPV